MRWLRKIIRVVMVVALGAAASLPFRLLPPPHGGPGGASADRIVLQNDSTTTAQQTPLQIAAPPMTAASNADIGEPTFESDATRTASNRPAQVTRKDLPAWNSKLESSSPPPPLPDTFQPNGTGAGTQPNGTSPYGAANPTPPAEGQNGGSDFPFFTPGGS